MAGTGNLILKRGTTIPQDGQNSATPQLLKAMPATQLVGLSHVVDTSGTVGGTLVYAYENYPNRLWIGMDAFGDGTQAESGGGAGGGSGPGTTGGSGAPNFTTQNASGAATRPIWFGAEIRADAAVLGASDTVPTILQADWTNASDYVLVTQKSIKSYVDPLVAGKGSMTSFNVSADVGSATTIINSDTLALTGGIGVDTSVNGDAVTFTLDLTELTTEGSPAVGDLLSGVDVSPSNLTRNFTIGTALGVLGGDISVNTSTGSATVSATNVKAEASTDASTFLAILDTASATAQPVKYHTGLTYDTTTSSLTVTGDLAVNGGDITTTAGTATVFNTTATALSIGAATSTLNIGYASSGGQTAGQTINLGTQTSASGVKTINILTGNATAGASTANILTSVLTGTVNILTGVSGTNANINLGSATATNSTVTVNKDLVVSGNLTVNGTTTTVNSTTLTVDDKNIELGSVSGATIATGTVSNISGSGPWTADFTVSGQVTGIVVGATISGETGAGGLLYGGSPTSSLVTGVVWNGSNTIISYIVTGGTIPLVGIVISVTVTGATDTIANGGGITLKGTTDKTLLWNSTELGGVPGVWRSSENFSIASSKSYAVVDDIVLTKTYLKLYNASAGGSISIKSPSVGSDIGTQLYTLPSTLGTANQVLTVSGVSGGDATLLWVDQSSLSTGVATAVKLRRETNSTTKFPIMFGASAADGAMSSWSSVDENVLGTASVATDVYLMADWDGAGEAAASTGLYYAPGESATGTQPSVSGGTLYAAFFAGYLDCGTYS